MTIDRSRPLLLVLPVLCAAALAAAAEAPAPAPVPLAYVGEDTITTTHLRIELAVMRNRNTDGVETTLADPDAILSRMTQNQLIVQEGYRMGLDQEFSVRNQVKEAVRHEMMKALLDSVAGSAPRDVADVHEARRQAVDAYLQDLSRRYAVSVDSLLLQRLDYGSDDAEMIAYLRDGKDVLATIGERDLTVADFSRTVRFIEFHGLVGKPDAAERRDKILYEWISEATLTRQALAQRMDQSPAMLTLAERLERNYILEEALRLLLQFDFAPTPDEIEAYYQANLDRVTPAPRVKMHSLKVGSAADAWELHEKIEKGATVRWLVSNDPKVVQGPAPFPEDWFLPAQLGLKPEEMQVGYVPEPYQVPTGWVVAVVAEIEKPAPTPLDQCRGDLLRMMKAEAVKSHMIEILARLEEVSPVTILPGARNEVAQIVMETEIASQQDRQAAQPAAE